MVENAHSSATPAASTLNQQLIRLSNLIGLEKRSRDVNAKELGFVIVNETLQVISYRQAVLWQTGKGITNISGISTPEAGAPYLHWLNRLVAEVSKGKNFNELHVIDQKVLSVELTKEWQEWFPENVLWCPLLDRKQRILGVLLLTREEEWQEGDAQIASLISQSYAQSLLVSRFKLVSLKLGTGKRTKQALVLAVIGCILGTGFIPIHASVLASAQVNSQSSAAIRAPFTAVVDTIVVEPNAVVKSGDILVRLDKRQLQSQYDISLKALDVVQAEYLQASQEAVSDPKARGKLTLLKSKIDEQESDLKYHKSLFDQTEIRSDQAGVAIFDDPLDWKGKPVETGERIMFVSPPYSREIEIDVPVTDAIPFEIGAKVIFFDNINPQAAVKGEITFSSYSSSLNPEGILCYTLRANLNTVNPLRIGGKGTAKVFGAETPLALWILRKPIALVREWLAT